MAVHKSLADGRNAAPAAQCSLKARFELGSSRALRTTLRNKRSCTMQFDAPASTEWRRSNAFKALTNQFSMRLLRTEPIEWGSPGTKWHASFHTHTQTKTEK